MSNKSKYLINGTTSQVNRVQNLFHSVQLNVNNPHFLIMQGRITKVINMKPAEILGLIEEAAGTRMYQNKKQHALKTIEEKDRKRAEIDQLLNENIKPEIERLRKEKKNYMEYTNKQREIEEKNRFIVAYDYHKAQVNQNNNQKRMKKPLLKGFVVFSMCLMLDLKVNFGYKHQFVFFKKKN